MSRAFAANGHVAQQHPHWTVKECKLVLTTIESMSDNLAVVIVFVYMLRNHYAHVILHVVEQHSEQDRAHVFPQITSVLATLLGDIPVLGDPYYKALYSLSVCFDSDIY